MRFFWRRWRDPDLEPMRAAMRAYWRSFPGHRYRGEPCLYRREIHPDGRITEQCERCGAWRYVDEGLA